MAHSTVADIIGDRVRRALGGALSDQESEFNAITDQAASQADSALRSGLFGGGFSLEDLLLLIPGLGEVLTAPEHILRTIFGKAGEFVLGVASGWALGEFISEALRPIWSELTQDINSAVPSFPLDPATIARTAARGITGYDDSATEAARSAINGDRFRHLYHDALTAPTLEQAIELLRRNVAHPDDVREALTRDAIDPKWHDRLLTLQRNLLGAADLALAQLRGVMSLDDARKYAAQLGVDNADLDTLIANTGEPPGAESLMEALRRGFIKPDRFEHGIRQSRIRNEWIDVMTRLRYSPMSISDAVRAQVEGHMTTDETRRIAEQNGLEPGAVDILIESWGRPLAHEQMLMLYHRGQATLDQVKQAMRESDVKNKYIEQAIELGRRLVPERTIVSMLDHGVVNHETAMTMLREQGYNTRDGDALIRLGAAQRLSSHKTLSKGDTLAMYEDGLIKHQEAVKHLTAMGYTDADATQMLDLADYKRKASLLKVTQREIQAAHKAGHLDDQQAADRLVKAGLDAAQARDIVDLWNGEKRIITRTLTEKQIIDAIGGKIITAADGRERLLALGFGSTDVTIIFMLNGIEPIPARPISG